ncbi:MAG: thioredoxin [Bacteroidales bacterium]|jgi:thioredoxin 1
MKTTLIISLIIIGSFAILFLFGRAKLRNIPTVANHNSILELTDKNFQFQTKDKLVLVDFWASWCAPCRMMAPVLNEVAGDLSEDSFVGKVDVEANQALAQKYQVRSIPTMILFKNGKEVSRFVGIKSKEFLLQQIKSIKKSS